MKACTIYCVLFLFLLLNSCKENDDDYSVGIITGSDFRFCACCGGFFIEIEDETYRFFNDELPEGSPNFYLMDVTFPLKVHVQWKLKENSCMGDEILVTNIEIPG